MSPIKHFWTMLIQKCLGIASIYDCIRFWYDVSKTGISEKWQIGLIVTKALMLEIASSLIVCIMNS